MIYEVIPADEIMPERIIRTDDDGSVWFIPADEANADYQAYLKSLEPEIVEEPVVEEAPADEPVTEAPASE